MAEIKEIKSLEEYKEFISGSDNLSVLKVGADWCVQCKFLTNTLMFLSNEEVDGVSLAEVNADEEWFEDELDKLNIRGLPVMIAFKGGEEKERITGNQPKSAIIEFINRNK